MAIPEGSALARLVGAGVVQTNSRHHQAVPDGALGRGLTVTARSADGIIEGLEAPGRRWLIAVQWHPERDEVAERFRPLFESFVAAAAVTPASAAGG